MREIPPPSWPILHTMGSSSRPVGCDAAFQWGLDVLERWLGEEWPAACYRAGGLPPELGASAGTVHGLAMLIDLAGAVELLGRGKGMGKIRRALRSSPNWETIASARCALRLAVAGLRAGFRPEPEYGHPPMDLMLAGPSGGLGIEIKTLRRTDMTIEIDRWLGDLTLRLLTAMSNRDVLITGDAREVLDEQETAALADRIIAATGLVRAGLEAPTIWAGRNRFDVRRPEPNEEPGSRIALPAGDLWRRTKSRIASAAKQVVKSRATWLVIESLDNLWELTPWSRESAAVRASSLAEVTRDLLVSEPHVEGVAFTDGAAMTDPGSPDDDLMTDPGVMFVRRRLDRVRSRQTIVIARSHRGTASLTAWRLLLDAEPGFAEWALPRFGLTGPPELAIRST